MVRTGATFADAAAEWLRYIEHDRGPQALDAGRLPVDSSRAAAARVGDLPLESITASTIERWIGTVEADGQHPDQRPPVPRVRPALSA